MIAPKTIPGLDVKWRGVGVQGTAHHAEFELTHGPIQMIGWARPPNTDGDSSVTLDLPDGAAINHEAEIMVVAGFREQVRKHKEKK